MATKIDVTMGQLQIPSDIGRDLLAGEIVIRDPVSPYQANIPTLKTDMVFGVLDEEAGATTTQAMRVRFMRRGERKVRIQDNATVALGSLLEPSTTDTGSAKPYDGGYPFGRALEAITSGTTAQYVNAELWCDGSAPHGPISASFTPAAAAANVCEVTIKLLDAAGKVIAEPWLADVFLSDSAAGVGLTGTTTSGTVTAKAASGAVFSTYTAKKDLRVQALATGTFILEITDTGKTGFYVCVRLPGGLLAVSAVLVTANYGA